jgi:hypothetical protein
MLIIDDSLYQIYSISKLFQKTSRFLLYKNLALKTIKTNNVNQYDNMD